MNSCLIENNCCNFDYSAFPNMRRRAEELVKYFEEKYPEIIKILKTNDAPTKVVISFVSEELLAGKYDTNNIKMNPNKIPQDNKGVLVHEGTHIVQGYPEGIDGNSPYWWIMEGLADYVRQKLGWGEPSHPFDGCQRGQTYKIGYQCAAEFLSWLEKRDTKGNFVAELNKLVKEKCMQRNQADIDNFFNGKFGKTPDGLWNEYKKNNP